MRLNMIKQEINILNTITNARKTKVTFNILLEYSIKKYFLNIFNLNILLIQIFKFKYPN